MFLRKFSSSNFTTFFACLQIEPFVAIGLVYFSANIYSKLFWYNLCFSLLFWYRHTPNTTRKKSTQNVFFAQKKWARNCLKKFTFFFLIFFSALIKTRKKLLFNSLTLAIATFFCVFISCFSFFSVYSLGEQQRIAFYHRVDGREKKASQKKRFTNKLYGNLFSSTKLQFWILLFFLIFFARGWKTTSLSYWNLFTFRMGFHFRRVKNCLEDFQSQQKSPTCVE